MNFRWPLIATAGFLVALTFLFLSNGVFHAPGRGHLLGSTELHNRGPNVTSSAQNATAAVCPPCTAACTPIPSCPQCLEAPKVACPVLPTLPAPVDCPTPANPNGQLRAIVVCRICPWDGAGTGNHLLSYRGLLMLAEMFPGVPIWAHPRGGIAENALDFLDKPFANHNIFIVDDINGQLSHVLRYSGMNSIYWMGSAAPAEDGPRVQNECKPDFTSFQHEGPVQLPYFNTDWSSDIRDKVLATNKPVVGISDAFHLAWVAERRFSLHYSKPEPPFECQDCPPVTAAATEAFDRMYKAFAWKESWTQHGLNWISKNIGLKDKSGQPYLPYAVFFRRNLYTANSCSEPSMIRKNACSQSLNFCLELLTRADRAAIATGSVPPSHTGKLGFVSLMIGRGLQDFTPEELQTMEQRTHSVAYHGMAEVDGLPSGDVFLSFVLGALADVAYLNSYSSFSQQVFAMRMRLGKPASSNIWY